MKHTPDFITRLNENEVFVFGSNLRGLHGGGAARIAFEKFGAEWGVGVGPTDQCYTIPTMHGGIDEIAPYVNDFVAYAKQHSDQHFYVTRIGCGIAGFTDEQMAPLFQDLLGLDNVSIPKQWVDILQGVSVACVVFLSHFYKKCVAKCIFLQINLVISIIMCTFAS